MKKISTIEAKTKDELNGRVEHAKKRVAAYCRVSSDTSKQMASFDTQVQYYTNYIQSRKDWEFAGIYSDGGISGTEAQNRREFNRLLRDCRIGKIDIILTKSISRFARNAADCIEAVRLLKLYNVSVIFERENINTQSAESELFLAVLSSLAQEESFNISQNIKWSIQKRFKKGKLLINTRRFLGYDSDGVGGLIVNEQEAAIVKRIFNDYISGSSINDIKASLEADRVKTVTELSKWPEATIRGILTNEKYKGAAILQKTYTPDFLSHKKKVNRGELPQYYIENSHPAIVSKKVFDKVQALMAERAGMFGNNAGDRNKYSKQYTFSGKLICGKCGQKLKRRIWNSKEKSKQVVWQCTTYIKQGKEACDMKALDDITLKAVFVRAFNRFFTDGEALMKTFLANVSKVLGSENKESQELKEQRDKTSNELKLLIRQHIKGELKQEDFLKKQTCLQDELQKIRGQMDRCCEVETKKEETLKRTSEIQAVLKGREGIIEEFDEEIFAALVEKVLLISPTQLHFELKNGIVLKESFIKKKGIHGLQ